MTTVIAYILVIMTIGNDGPRITMQEFSSQESCMAEKGRIDTTLKTANERLTIVRCSPKA